jgi:hypothetical protein
VAWHAAEAFEKENPFSGHSLPAIMQYQTTINRQLFQAMNQLERLQRLRKGDNVPVNLEVFSEPPTAATRRLYLTNLTRGILLSLLQLSLGRGFVEIIRKR